MAADRLPRQPGKRGKGKPFASGASGNPAGPKPGSRHPALAALDAIGLEGAEAIIRKVMADALEGDARSAEIILRRAWPERRGRPVTVDLPELKTPGDLVPALAALTHAVATGSLTPDEGHAVAGVLEIQRRVLETHDLAARIEALEQAQTEEQADEVDGTTDEARDHATRPGPVVHVRRRARGGDPGRVAPDPPQSGT